MFEANDELTLIRLAKVGNKRKKENFNFTGGNLIGNGYFYKTLCDRDLWRKNRGLCEETMLISGSKTLSEVDVTTFSNIIRFHFLKTDKWV